MKNIEEILEKKGVKSTSNRLVVLKKICEQTSPVSLSELENMLFPMDKSSIFRALSIFVSNHVVHAIEDGAGVTHYELCNGEHDCSVEDMHVHFYCESCKQSTCFPKIAIPQVNLPEEYQIDSITYMVKGICPKCARKNRTR